MSLSKWDEVYGVEAKNKKERLKQGLAKVVVFFFFKESAQSAIGTLALLNKFG